VVFEITIKFELLFMVNSDIILQRIANNTRRENLCYFMQHKSKAYAATFSVTALEEVLGE